MIGEIVQAQASLSQQRVVRCDDDAERIRPDRLHRQLRDRLRGQGDDAEFELAGEYAFAGDLRIHEVNVEIDFGITLREAAQYRRQPMQADVVAGADRQRSEEHTSELQSLMRISYAVFCLKKKNRKKQSQDKHTITLKA